MEDPQRVLALDLGKKRIGLALSDALGMTAQGLPTLERTTLREDLRHLSHLARENNVSLILLGLPLHLSGAEGRQASWVREFGERLGAETGVKIGYWDERLTTVEAMRVLKLSGISLQKRIRAVDKLSAVILLESYLASHDS